jgi:hypothetical protein
LQNQLTILDFAYLSVGFIQGIITSNLHRETLEIVQFILDGNAIENIKIDSAIIAGDNRIIKTIKDLL